MKYGFSAGLYFTEETSTVLLPTTLDVVSGDTLELGIFIDDLSTDRGLFGDGASGTRAFVRTDGDIRLYNEANVYIQFNSNLVANTLYDLKFIRTVDSWALYNGETLLDTKTLSGSFLVSHFGRLSTFDLNGFIYKIKYNDTDYNLHEVLAVDANKLYLPAKNSTTDVIGNELTNPATVGHNGSENTLLNYKSYELHKADSLEVDGTPLKYLYGENLFTTPIDNGNHSQVLVSDDGVNGDVYEVTTTGSYSAGLDFVGQNLVFTAGLNYTQHLLIKSISGEKTFTNINSTIPNTELTDEWVLYSNNFEATSSAIRFGILGVGVFRYKIITAALTNDDTPKPLKYEDRAYNTYKYNERDMFFSNAQDREV